MKNGSINCPKFICEICDKNKNIPSQKVIFKSEENLVKHMMNIHNKILDDWMCIKDKFYRKCRSCGKKIITNQNIQYCSFCISKGAHFKEQNENNKEN